MAMDGADRCLVRDLCLGGVEDIERVEGVVGYG